MQLVWDLQTLFAERKFTSKVTGKIYFVKGNLSCNSKKVIYLTTCDKCKDEYIGSAVVFKPCFRVHKSDKKAKRETLWYLWTFQWKMLLFHFFF